MAFIGVAVLASTDPVVLREIVRDEPIPRPVRQELDIEAGMNDLVVLPVLLVLIAVATDQAGGTTDWAIFLVKLLVLGSVIGFAVGGVGSWLMSWMVKKLTIRTEHQSLYGVVVALYSAATAAGGDGFLRAFAVGLAVVMLNQGLCDCSLEYREVCRQDNSVNRKRIRRLMLTMDYRVPAEVYSGDAARSTEPQTESRWLPNGAFSDFGKAAELSLKIAPTLSN